MLSRCIQTTLAVDAPAIRFFTKYLDTNSDGVLTLPEFAYPVRPAPNALFPGQLDIFLGNPIAACSCAPRMSKAVLSLCALPLAVPVRV